MAKLIRAGTKLVKEGLEARRAEKAAEKAAKAEDVFDPYAVRGSDKAKSKIIMPDDERFGGPLPNPPGQGRTGIFDYDYKMPIRSSGVQRYTPPRGTPLRTEELLRRRDVFDKMVAGTERGMEMSPDDWYEVGPIFKSFVDEFGQDEGMRRFDAFTAAVAGTSPRSKVGENVRNATYYYGQANPPPGTNYQPTAADLPEKPPKGYGHLAQNLHRMNAEKTLYPDSPGFSEKSNPKPLSFMWNFRGDPNLATIDTHAFRAPAMLGEDPRFLETQFVGEKGGDKRNILKEFEAGDISMDDLRKWGPGWQSKPKENEYAAYENYYRKIADELGITPRHAQGSAWIGHGEMTGLESAPKPFMDFVEERILKTAKERGMDPADVWREAIRGVRPLTLDEKLLEGLPGASMTG